MQLAKLALFFSRELSAWPQPLPSKALPFYLKAFLKNSVGKTIHSQDISSSFEPQRMGVWSRDFQTGDPLKALSMSALCKHNRWMANMEQKPGRRVVIVLFHKYENMCFSSQPHLPNKGQLAHAVIAVLEKMHLNLGQEVHVVPLEGAEIGNAVDPLLRRFSNVHQLYFLSDFLFGEPKREGCAETLELWLDQVGPLKQTYMMLRDNCEVPHGRDGNEVFLMEPWKGAAPSGKRHEANENYDRHCEEQIQFVQKRVEKKGHPFFLFTPNHTLLDVMNATRVL
jgi:hypothetical protein